MPCPPRQPRHAASPVVSCTTICLPISVFSSTSAASTAETHASQRSSAVALAVYDTVTDMVRINMNPLSRGSQLAAAADPLRLLQKNSFPAETCAAPVAAFCATVYSICRAERMWLRVALTLCNRQHTVVQQTGIRHKLSVHVLSCRERSAFAGFWGQLDFESAEGLPPPHQPPCAAPGNYQ